MRDFSFYSPTEIVFGKDAELNCGALCKKYGGSRIFVVYGGSSAKKSGLLDKVIKSIEETGLAVKSSGGVVPNPVLSSTYKMIEEAKEFGADMVVGIGGGSAIDQAKAVAHGTANPDCDVWDFWSGKKALTHSIPIAAIPTLPATGTECSNSSVITDDISPNTTKRGLTSELNRCVFTTMNPSYCLTLPKYQKGAGSADIFMHNAERFFTIVDGNHLTDEFAYAVFKNIMHYGRIMVNEPENYEAMSEVMLTGTFAHNSLTGMGAKGDTPREGDWSCHQIGMAISAVYNSTHGATLTAIFGSWARYVMDAKYSRFADFGRRLFGITEADDKKAAELAVDEIEKYFADLEMPLNLTALLGHKPTEDEIEALTNAATYNNTRTFGTFKVLGQDDVRAIFTAAV